MYPTSADFITALHAPARFERIRGTIGATPFDDSNIISLSYSNRCSDTADVSLGSCYIGQLEATFTNVSVLRGEWRNKVITLEWGLVLEDESVEYIPVGVFTITEATWSGTGVSIKASDNISKLDKECGISTTDGSIYDLLALAALECGLSLAQTKAEIDLLPNGDQVFGLYPENDIKTWRDFVSWVVQLCGGFAYADRAGQLAVKSWGSLSVVDSLSETEREYQTTFSDYSTQYDGVSVVNIADQVTMYFSNGHGGSVINLGSNPFLQFGLKETISIQGGAIADAVGNIAYTPFNSGVLSNVAYDLGDILTCSGGIAGSGTLYCCVMSIDWTSKNLTTLQGFGADPSLTSGKSKTDKALSGLMSKTKENEVIIYTFENAQSYSLGEEEAVEILSIRFATISPKIVNLWHEIKLDVEAVDDSKPIVCVARYYLDSELITYSPVTSWDNDGYHLLHLLYFLAELAGNTPYTWSVTLELINATGTISTGDIHASLYGQGLVATDTWNGLIEVSDSFSIRLGSHYETNFSETSVSVDNTIPSIPDAPSVSDSFSLRLGSHYGTNITESVTINLEAPIYNYVTENDIQLITEDGDILTTEGDE